jgi:hypothetical protein
MAVGRHPHCHFRGLHRLHSITAHRIARPPKVTFVTRLQPSGYRTNRQLSGWNPPPLMMRALVAHCQLRALYSVETRHLNSVAYLRAICQRCTAASANWNAA